MAAHTHFSADDARRVGAEIGIDWDSALYTRLERMEERARRAQGGAA